MEIPDVTPGYPDKTPSAPRPIITDGYNSHGTKTMPPDAAKFNRGAQLIEQIRHATGQRRAHSEALSDPGRKGWQKQSPLS
jgi:hypothetical protein